MSRIGKLEELLKVNGNDSFLKHALALEYIKTGEDLRARELFEAILLYEPGYVGSYYHLGKLLERINEPEAAKKIYAAGIEQTNKIKDRHASSELQGALDDLEN